MGVVWRDCRCRGRRPLHCVCRDIRVVGGLARGVELAIWHRVEQAIDIHAALDTPLRNNGCTEEGHSIFFLDFGDAESLLGNTVVSPSKKIMSVKIMLVKTEIGGKAEPEGFQSELRGSCLRSTMAAHAWYGPRRMQPPAPRPRNYSYESEIYTPAQSQPISYQSMGIGDHAIQDFDHVHRFPHTKFRAAAPTYTIFLENHTGDHNRLERGRKEIFTLPPRVPTPGHWNGGTSLMDAHPAAIEGALSRLKVASKNVPPRLRR